MAKVSVENATILAAALEGLESQRARLDEQIRSVRAALGGRGSAPKASPATTEGAAKPKRQHRELSAAARARIAAAQKKRWAEYRKTKEGEQ